MQNSQIEPDGERPDDLINDSDYRSSERTDRSAESGFAATPSGNPEREFSTSLGREAADSLPASTESLRSTESSLGQSAANEKAVEGQFYTLDLRSIKAERLGNAIFTCLLLLGALVWVAIRWWTEGVDLFFQILAGASLILVTAFAVFSWIWPKKEFQYTQWRATNAGLEIHKGVIWRHRIIVPMSRVQHADVTQGPIQRLFGLGTLVVHTAGTSNASVDLAGIDHQAAIEVRDMIIRFRSGRQERHA